MIKKDKIGGNTVYTDVASRNCPRCGAEINCRVVRPTKREAERAWDKAILMTNICDECEDALRNPISPDDFLEIIKKKRSFCAEKFFLGEKCKRTQRYAMMIARRHSATLTIDRENWVLNGETIVDKSTGKRD